MDDLDRNIAEGYSRLADFVFDVTDADREPRADWRKAVLDAASDLDRIACNPLAHPDDCARARLAMGSPAHIWLSVEEAEAVYLGGRTIPGSTPHSPSPPADS